MSNYDVVILGGGPGGYNAAIRAGQLGLKAACVEGRATLGGTCLNVGCMPSKALLHASELYDAAMGTEFANLGIEVKPTLNLAQMMKQKDESVAGLTKGIEFLFRKNKVDWIKGWGHIDGPGKVSVTDTQGNKVELTAKDIIIATGSGHSPARRRNRQPAHPRFHRCAVPERSAPPSSGHRCRRDRSGTRLSLATARCAGDGDRIPRPHLPRCRR